MQDLIAERMEKYARASGHPRLVELLSRHANEQKDKFTLSDDEDQARTGLADSKRQTGWYAEGPTKAVEATTKKSLAQRRQDVACLKGQEINPGNTY